MIENMKIGVVGAGNMATAIIRGLLAVVSPLHITVSDKDANKLEELSKLGVITTEVNEDVAKSSDIVILAVKPNIYPVVLDEIKAYNDKLFITIAPGISIDFCESYLGEGARIIRTMPNMPAQINSGMTVFCRKPCVSNDDAELADEILSCFGVTMELEEKLLNAAVSVNGSGPAYVFMMIEAMADAAVMFGIPRDKAYILASQTVAGSAEMIFETGKHPGELKDMVCSPGGTTIEATASLEASGFRASLIEAMKKCFEKSQNMSNQN